MNHHYKDIRERIAGSPRWFDEAGVPRYCDFSPDDTNNIYATHVVLLGIACQCCGHRFRVCLSEDVLGRNQLVKAVRQGYINYGDPPNIECCPAGPTMSSNSLRVLEFWAKDEKHHWVRVPELEIELED